MAGSIPERFALIRYLREDRYSKTFLGNDQLLDRQNLVIKIISKDYVRASRDQLFEKFSWLIGVKHPQLASILDAGLTERGHLYCVREHLPNSELMSANPLLILKSLISLLQFLSRHEQIHGGIKPSNVFVANENVRLTDPMFSGAYVLDEVDALHYVAPEVLLGNQMTRESDFYSVGATIFAITGRHIFEDSDINRLRSKYLSASPQLAAPQSPIPQSILELVLELLDRKPENRTSAFENLKRVLGAQDDGASQAAFIGRKAIMETIVSSFKVQTESLRAVLIEGVTGIGKSRIVDELRLYCNFNRIEAALCHSARDSSAITQITVSLCNFLRCRSSVAEGRRINLHIESTPESDQSASVSTSTACLQVGLLKKISDLLGALTALSRRRHVVLIVEDIDYANTVTLTFLEQLVFRVYETGLTLILTMRPCETEPRLVNTISVCLDKQLLRLRVQPLSAIESEKLAGFIESDPEAQKPILQMSGGNPLFLERTATLRHLPALLKSSMTRLAALMLSKATPETLSVLRLLSVFRGPVPQRVVALSCDGDFKELNERLNAASDLGLVDCEEGKVGIRYQIIREVLYDELSKRIKLKLNKKAFGLLKQSGGEDTVLADHAFKAGLVADASLIYRRLAREAYQSQNFKLALTYYERVEHIHKTSLDKSSALSLSERFEFARCYEWAGKQKLAKSAYQRLLAIDSVQKDPELLSTAYFRLATAFDKTPSKDRIHFQELAIQCLPKDSPNLGFRYAQLAAIFLKTREMLRAEQAFARGEQCIWRHKSHLAGLNIQRASLLMNQGNFGDALRWILSSLREYETPTIINTAVLNNLGLCYEALGNLQKASEHQIKAEKWARISGTSSIHVLSLGNLGSIATKTGDLSRAKELFDRAFDEIRALRVEGDSFNRDRFITVAYDAAHHAVHSGDYQHAALLLQKAPIDTAYIFEMDRMFCQNIRCRFLLRIDSSNRVRDLLTAFRASSCYSSDFNDIEWTLIEAQLPEIAAPQRYENLVHALALSERLGTVYQQCELQISLTAVAIERDDMGKASSHAKEALEIAKKNSYRLLEARALFLSGLASTDTQSKKHMLFDALQLASEIGLQELIAETSLHLGLLNLESGNTFVAREYFIRSTSITARLSEGVPSAARARYLARKWRRDALKLLDQCNSAVPLHISELSNAENDKYFNAAYQFTMSASAASSVEALVVSIKNLLETYFTRPAVVTLKSGANRLTSATRIKVTDELIQTMDQVRSRAKNRVFFDSVDARGKQTCGWVPLISETCDGGIYVASRPHERQFTEKEIELLTMMGTIACSALRKLETSQALAGEPQELSEFHGIIGASKAMKELYSQIQIAATNAATVLIEGESGTGKELVAKAIHAAGDRSKASFVAVDCGAIPETLIEAELFGAKKGSYTGAVADRPGLFESAHRGTLFLDEISNMPSALQVKLLRVIQEREIRRIGETKGRSIDVRLIVASNQSLEELADAGQFRKDLLYRLRVLHLRVPPLRNRRDDVPMLANAFLQRLNTNNNKVRKYFAPEVVDSLSMQEFPGNVRELQNAIERAFFSTPGVMITDVGVYASAITVAGPVDEVQGWFKDISEGRKDFWSAIQRRYKRRDISREKVVALVDFGLRSTRGSYKTMAMKFRLREKEYRRFMDFLRRNECLLDFRPYRKLPHASSEN